MKMKDRTGSSKLRPISAQKEVLSLFEALVYFKRERRSQNILHLDLLRNTKENSSKGS